MVITCCKNCKPPKRHIGCHSDCKQYIKEKEEFEKQKAKIDKNKQMTYIFNNPKIKKK